MENERLKIMFETLVKLAELWMKVPPNANAHSVYVQIDFTRKQIREELKYLRSIEPK